jgi:phosphoglycolate phosphatase
VSVAGRLAGVVFDLDGTLVDSRRDLATAVNRLREEMGLAALGVAAVEAMVGEGARVLVERALADAGGGNIPAERALARFIAHYDACCLDTTVAYAGIPELLRDLSARLPLAVLTNKPEGMTRKILEHLGLAAGFRLVVGGDSLPARKPDPAGLWHIARALARPPGDLVLVGDSRFDAETARAAGCRLLLVEWGYGRSADLAAVPPPVRVATVRELSARLLGRSILSS